VADLLIDTDVFVDHLRGARELRPRRDDVSYPVITRCELFAGRETEEQAVTVLLGPFRELTVDRAIAERAGKIRRETGMRARDALIAATALEHRLTLLTRNLRDFEPIRALRLSAPA
jgi:predicted nucleic acid-binding protein